LSRKYFGLEVLVEASDVLLSVSDAAKRLGGISKWTVHAWLSQGRLNRTKVGGRTMIRESELQKVIEEGGNPHSFRKTLVRLGLTRCQTPEQFKAWSQNLGHEKVLTTFVNYGEVACQRQGEIMRDLGTPQVSPKEDLHGIFEAFAKVLRESGSGMQVK
jgi:excisionase family DNA binding protein